MKVVVDYDLCEANALCMKAAPEIFRVEDDDTLTVLIDAVPGDLKEKAYEAGSSLSEAGDYVRRVGAGFSGQVLLSGWDFFGPARFFCRGHGDWPFARAASRRACREDGVRAGMLGVWMR